MPLGAGKSTHRQAGGAGLLRRCRGIRHGKSPAGACPGLSGRCRGDRARTDRCPQRRGSAGRTAGARFLRHFPFRPADPVGGHREAAGLRRHGRFLRCAVQSLLQGQAGLSGKGGAHPAGKWQKRRYRLRHCAQYRPGGSDRPHSDPCAAEKHHVDMFTTVYIGNAATKQLGGRMVTPRGYRR